MVVRENGAIVDWPKSVEALMVNRTVDQWNNSASETADVMGVNPKLVLSDLAEALDNISETLAPQNFEDLNLLIASINEDPDEDWNVPLNENQVAWIINFYTQKSIWVRNEEPVFDTDKYKKYPLMRVLENASLDDTIQWVQERKTRITTALQSEFDFTPSDEDLQVLTEIHAEYADIKEERLFAFTAEERTKLLRDINRKTQWRVSPEMAKHLADLGLEGLFKSIADLVFFKSKKLKMAWLGATFWITAPLAYYSYKLWQVTELIIRESAKAIWGAREHTKPQLDKLVDVLTPVLEKLQEYPLIKRGVERMYGSEIPLSSEVERGWAEMDKYFAKMQSAEQIANNDYLWQMSDVLWIAWIAFALVSILSLLSSLAHPNISRDEKKFAMITAVVSAVVAWWLTFAVQQYFGDTETALETLKALGNEAAKMSNIDQ